jgi:RNA polymerase sigma-70 factor, ECF subfamily
VPAASELPDRLPGVLRVIYLIFTEGYAASGGTMLIRQNLEDEAIRLARILRRLLSTDREVAGLLALLLLIDARRDARVDPAGNLVLLADQNRSRWNRDLIEEGRRHLISALAGSSPGPYALQGAIAALHDDAAGVDTTDWPQIVALYSVLQSVATSPMVDLNRAVAVSMVQGPAAGLDLVDTLGVEGRLDGYYMLHATRADLLRRLHRDGEAADAYRSALRLVGNEPERIFLSRRLSEVSTEPSVSQGEPTASG